MSIALQIVLLVYALNSKDSFVWERVSEWGFHKKSDKPRNYQREDKIFNKNSKEVERIIAPHCLFTSQSQSLTAVPELSVPSRLERRRQHLRLRRNSWSETRLKFLDSRLPHRNRSGPHCSSFGPQESSSPAHVRPPLSAAPLSVSPYRPKWKPRATYRLLKNLLIFIQIATLYGQNVDNVESICQEAHENDGHNAHKDTDDYADDDGGPER